MKSLFINPCFCKHIAKASQADAKPKLWQRACKSEPVEF